MVTANFKINICLINELIVCQNTHNQTYTVHFESINSSYLRTTQNTTLQLLSLFAFTFVKFLLHLLNRINPMENGINKRLVALMEKLGYRKSEYAEMLGVSAAVISHIYNDRNKAGLELVQNILTHFPKINERWLLLGEGEMFKEDNAMSNLVLKEKIQMLYKKINAQKSNLNELIADLEGIKDIIS